MEAVCEDSWAKGRTCSVTSQCHHLPGSLLCPIRPGALFLSWESSMPGWSSTIRGAGSGRRALVLHLLPSGVPSVKGYGLTHWAPERAITTSGPCTPFLQAKVTIR